MWRSGEQTDREPCEFGGARLESESQSTTFETLPARRFLNRIRKVGLPAASTATAAPAAVTGSSNVLVSTDLSGLSPSSTYYFRVSTNSAGVIATGGVSALLTASSQPLTVTTTTPPATVIGDTVAAVGGTVSTTGLAMTASAVEYTSSFTGFESVVATNNASLAAGYNPTGVCLDAAGNIYYTDFVLRAVRATCSLVWRRLTWAFPP